MVLEKDYLQDLNRYMLGLGAPVERDGIGYSKPDFGLMEGVGRFLPELSDDMAYAVAERLSHYKNTQLGEYADDLDETVAYYKELTRKDDPVSFRAISEDYSVNEFLPYQVHKAGEEEENVLLTFDGKIFLPNIDIPYWSEVHWKHSEYKILIVPKTRLNDFMDRIKNEGKYGFEPDDDLKEYMEFLEKESLKPVDSMKIAGKTETGYYVRFTSFADIRDFMAKENSITPDCLKWKRVGDKIVLHVKRDELFYLYREARELGFYNAQLEAKMDSVKLLADDERIKSKTGQKNNYTNLPAASGNKLVDWHNFDLPFTPYDFQIEDANRIVERKRMLMGQDMGCGKSFIATLVGTSIDGAKLAIVPESLRLNWRKEIKNVTPDANIRILYSKDGFDLKSNELPDWTIVGYSTVGKFAEQLKAMNFRCVFVDEAHNCKAVNNYGEPASKRAQAVLDICDKAEYVYPMTGTPIPTRNKDLYNIIKMLKMEKVGNIQMGSKWSFYKFGNEFCDGHNNGFGWSCEGNSNSGKLHECLNPYMVRRLKKDVLPNLTKQRLFVATESVSKEYKDIEKRLHNMEPNDTYMGLAMTGRNILSREKVKPAMDLADSLLEEDKSVVIVSNFNETLDTIVGKYGDDCCTIRGGMSDVAKQKAIDDFQSGKKHVCALNVIAGGVGVTLTKAHDMIICDYDWTPSNMAQVEDRICRTGQTEGCNIHYIYCENSVLDQTFVDMITNKSANIDKVVDGADNTMDMKSELGFMKRLQAALGDVKANSKDNIDMSRFDETFVPMLTENHTIEKQDYGYVIDGAYVRNRDLNKCMNFKKDATVIKKVEMLAESLRPKEPVISKQEPELILPGQGNIEGSGIEDVIEEQMREAVPENDVPGTDIEDIER